MKFTFKQRKYRSGFFFNTLHEIKLNKKVCGTIYCEDTFPIHITIEKDKEHDDKNPNCSWMWITLRKKSETIEEAKTWLIENTDKINKQFKLHFTD